MICHSHMLQMILQILNMILHLSQVQILINIYNVPQHLLSIYMASESDQLQNGALFGHTAVGMCQDPMYHMLYTILSCHL